MRAAGKEGLPDTQPESITSGGLRPQHSPTTERERTKGNWAQKGKARSVPAPASRGLCCPETTVRKNIPVPPGEFTQFIRLFKGRQDRQENEQTHI